ncbi:MAG TPA: polymer-forming cytoskeletal protein [Polyangiaceae bacterium]|jgi:cytoskeletal protein CcmA (bactofilin family)
MAQARTSTAHQRSEARIGSGARVRGRIHGDGDLLIEGHVEGDLAIRGDLTIASGADVSSEAVEAQSVTIAGTFEGDMAATGPVRVASGARVRGNLRGSAVSIEDGARFSGKLDCEFDLPPELGGAEARTARGSRR